MRIHPDTAIPYTPKRSAEHSYYDQYGPARGDLLDASFEVTDWDTVASQFEKTSTRHEQ